MTEFETHNDHEPRAWWRRPYEDIALAMTLLTRIPMPGFAVPKDAPLARAVWAFPIVGALIGAIGAAGFKLAIILHLGANVAVTIAVCAMVLATGALHEDGLADFFDGLGGGHDPQSRLEIMRDSRIGTYGAIALFFALALQAALLISLAQTHTPWPMWAVLIALAAISRAAILIPIAILPSARNTGLGTHVSNPKKSALLIGFALTAILAALLLGSVGAALAIFGAAIMSALVTHLAHRYLRGQTGDVLGATASMSMVCALIGLAIGGGHP